MQQKTKTDKLILSLMAIGYILWMGISLARSFIAFDLVKPGEEIVLNSAYSTNIAMQSVYIFSMLSVYSDIGFAIAALCVIILFILKRKQLRSKGWMFMAIILFILCVPAETVLIYHDIQLGLSVFWDNVRDINHPAIQDHFIGRLTNPLITVPSGLSFLSGLTAIVFVIWRPLNNQNN